MELTEDRMFEKNAKQCKHCFRNILLPYQNEYTGISCGYNLTEQKIELKLQRAKTFLSID